jgi:hypothetical protein
MRRGREFSIELGWQWGLIILLLPLLYLLNSFSDQSPQHYFSGPLFIMVQQNIVVSKSFVLVINIFLVYLSGFLGNTLFHAFRLLPRKNNFILIFFLLGVLQFPILQYFNPILPALPLILYSFFVYFRTTEQEFHKRDVVSINLILSLASLIYMPLISMLLFIPIGITLLSSLNFKLLLISLLSFLIPYLYLLAYFFLYDSLDNLWIYYSQFDMYFLSNWLHSFNINQITSIVFLFALVLLSWVLIGRAYNYYLIQSRRLIVFLIVFTIVFMIISVLYAQSATLNLFLLTLPMAVFLSLGVIEIHDRRYFWVLSLIMILLPLSQLYIWHF